jgi:hypothetical protein
VLSADFSDVIRLAVQLDRVNGEIPKGTRKALEVNAHHVKEAWQEGLNGSEVPAAGARSTTT